jgi:hypothetical protein
MIEIMKGFPEDVVAVNYSGHVTRGDYERILIPAVENALKTHEKLRLLFRIGPEFELVAPGAVLEDIKVGFAHLSHWERVAVVSDVGWLRGAVRAFAFLIPGQVKFFNVSDDGIARRWISENT